MAGLIISTLALVGMALVGVLIVATEQPISAQDNESISLSPPSVIAEEGTYTVTVSGRGWTGAPAGLFVTVCPGADGGDYESVNAANSLSVCPTLIADAGRGNPRNDGTWSYDLQVTVGQGDIYNGQIAILAGELAVGTEWSAGANLRVIGGSGASRVDTGAGSSGSTNRAGGAVAGNNRLGNSIPNVELRNTNGLGYGGSVRVTMATVGNCNSGNRNPVRYVYVLEVHEENTTGLLSASCDWEVKFSDEQDICHVVAQVINTVGSVIGDESDGSLILAGTGDNVALYYRSSPVASIEFAVTDTCNRNAVVTDSNDASGSNSVPPKLPKPEFSVSLSQGWMVLPFGGATGTTPSDFWEELDRSFVSLWVWDALTQSWKGWRQSATGNSLATLTAGVPVFIYVPKDVQVSYSTASLLQAVPVEDGLVLPTGYSLVSYGGSRNAEVISLLGNRARFVGVMYRWDSEGQLWEYFQPSLSHAPSTDDWFSELEPNDVVFILNRSTRPITIPWDS